MRLRSIERVKNLAGKRVLLRVDVNVPLDHGQVVDDTRIREIVPTLKFLLQKKARVIVLAHLGRPEGKIVMALKMDPVVARLSELLPKKIKKMEIGNGEWSNDLKNGEIVMLENIRFLPDEEKDSGELAQRLAALADIFVQDGFAVCHRRGASITGVAKLLPSYAGLLLAKEIAGLGKILDRPTHPLVAVIGGAKMAIKLPLIKKFSQVADRVLVGGGISSTVFAARGYGVGASLVDTILYGAAKQLARLKKIFLPIDVVVGTRNGHNWRVVEIGPKPHLICEKGEAIFDIGPATVALFTGEIVRANTLIWNGALGYFEQSPYDEGTLAVARALAARSARSGRRAFSVVGGGETVEIITQLKLNKKIDLVSTGGGAMLEFLAGKKLPGIIVLARQK